MKLKIVNYFQLANSFIGDIYFQVSKHLGITVSEVIRRKFTPDIKFLIFKYSQIARNKQEAYEDIKDNYDL